MAFDLKKIWQLVAGTSLQDGHELPVSEGIAPGQTKKYTIAQLKQYIWSFVSQQIAGITQGPQGAQGVPGATGATGAQGSKGDKGDTGSTGLKGDAGVQGLQGIAGPKGDKGDQGYQGVQGVQGVQGFNTWGDIDGSIENQTDLKDALDSKLDASDYNQYFRGKFASLEALEATVFNPGLKAGDNAQVDEGETELVRNYNWDADNMVWVIGGYGSSASNTDQLPEGSTNLYFTSARMTDAVNEAKKGYEKTQPVYAKMTTLFPMRFAGQITTISTNGLKDILVKINKTGTYTAIALPINYNAMDEIWFKFDYSDQVEPEGFIMLIGKDI